MGDYKTDYHGLHSVALLVGQTDARAPDYYTFGDQAGESLRVKCPECVAAYLVGWPQHYGQDEPFEILAERLRNTLVRDHRLGVRHRPALSWANGEWRPPEPGQLRAREEPGPQ